MLFGVQDNFDSASTAELTNFCKTGKEEQDQIHLETNESEGERGISNKLLLPGVDLDFPSEQTWELSADFANE